MKGDTSNKPSILKQVVQGVLIASAIGICGITALSILSKSRFDHRNTGGTLASVKSLAQAVEGFESEYGKLPDVSLMDFEAEGPEAAKLITVLLGREDNQPGMQNPRRLPFLITRITKNRKQGGLIFSPDQKIQGMYDYWGNPLRVMLRPPGQSTLAVPHLGGQITTSRPVIVLSRGQDQKWGTEDDLISDTGKR